MFTNINFGIKLMLKAVQKDKYIPIFEELD